MKKTKIFSLLLSLVLTFCCFMALGVTASAWDYRQSPIYDAAQLIEYGESEEGTIVLFLKNDILIDEPIDIKSHVTIDLNGHIIQRNRGWVTYKGEFSVAEVYESVNLSNGHVIEVHKNATLIIQDSSGNNSGKIANGDSTDTAGGIVINGGTVQMYGGAIVENQSWANGGGVHLTGDDSSRFEMYGGVIGYNAAGGCGGGICIEAGSAVIEGGTVTENECDKPGGGAIYVNTSHSGTALDITGSNGVVNFIDNHVSSSYADASSGNAADGGAIYIGDGKVNINNAKFAGNYTTCGDSHAITCKADDGATISNCVFEGNCYHNPFGFFLTDDTIRINSKNVKLNNITGDALIHAKGKDFEIGGKMVGTIFLDSNELTHSYIYLYDDLTPGSSINLDVRNIKNNGGTLVHCKEKAQAANNFEYFHVTADGIRSIAKDDKIVTAPRGTYTEPDTLNNQEPYRTYSVGLKTGGGWADSGSNEVWINLIGSQGETGKLQLKANYSKNSYRTFVFQGKDVGELQRFEIIYDSWDDWKLRWIDIENKSIHINRIFEDSGTVISVDYNDGAVSTVNGKATAGSVFGEGSVWVIVGVTVVLVAAAVTTVIVVKKRKKAAVAVADGADENSEE